MSFDLMVFERSDDLDTSEKFFSWVADELEWKEDRDYDSVLGTTLNLSSWFMEMKSIFPPMNGEFRPSDEDIDDEEDLKNHLADYSIGSKLIYSSFAWSLAEEASEKAKEIAKRYGLGFFNPQTAEIVCTDMVLYKASTERYEDKLVDWAQVEYELMAIDEMENGKPKNDEAFVITWFEVNGVMDGFMQCLPVYPPKVSFWKRLFSFSKSTAKEHFFVLEVSTGEKLFERDVFSKDELIGFFRDYYVSRKLPNVSGWANKGVL